MCEKIWRLIFVRGPTQDLFRMYIMIGTKKVTGLFVRTKLTSLFGQGPSCVVSSGRLRVPSQRTIMHNIRRNPCCGVAIHGYILRRCGGGHGMRMLPMMISVVVVVMHDAAMLDAARRLAANDAVRRHGVQCQDSDVT